MPRPKKTPRQPAPDMEARFIDGDSREELVAKVREKLGDSAKDMHFFFGAFERFQKGTYERQGYTPVLVDGKQIYDGDDPLLMIPEKRFNSHVRAAGLQSRKWCGKASRGELEASPRQGGVPEE